MSAGYRFTAADMRLTTGMVPADDRDRTYYARFTVYLGSCGNFDYWGDPDTGRVAYMGGAECCSGSYGDRFYWRSMTHHHARTGAVRTEAGHNW